MTNVPLVSIIITTKNEAWHIGNCLKSIKDQSYRNIEVIVVDNNSRDSTKDIVNEYRVSLYNKGPERSAQRNFGALKAKGQYVLFLDADMILPKNVVEECIRLITQSKTQHREIVALIIPEISVGTGYWAKCKALERSFYVGVDWIEAARFYKKEAFSMLRGYDETLTGPEDFDIQQRLRDHFGSDAIGRISLAIEHNEGNLSLGKTIRKKFYYARNLNAYAKKVSNKKYYRKQANILARYILFIKEPIRLFKHPFLGIGMLFLKTTEFIAGFLGLLYYSYINTTHHEKIS